MTKNSKRNSALLIAGCAVILALVALSFVLKPKGATLDPLKVSLLKVGKADAIVLQCFDKTMVIDAGEEEDGEEVVAFLTNQGINSVDYLIITHFDRDHVGGADTVVEALDVGQVFLPAYSGISTEYLDFMAALEHKGLVPQLLTEAVTLEFGSASVVIEPPLSYELPVNVAEFDNNFSLITSVVHGENRLLFTGDAEKQRIRQWVESGSAVDCDFIKMPHHGVYNTALTQLLDAVTPEYSTLCSSNKHPADPETLELLKQKGVRFLETKDGNVTVISNGSNLEIHQTLER